MGGGASKPIQCVNCKKDFDITLSNSCATSLCLLCNLNHIQSCSKCSGDESFGKENPEIKEIFQHISSQIKSKDEHITQLENTMSKNEAIANSLDVEQRMKIKSSEKENELLRQQVTELKSANSALGRKVAQLTSTSAKEEKENDELLRQQVTELKSVNSALEQKVAQLESSSANYTELTTQQKDIRANHKHQLKEADVKQPYPDGNRSTDFSILNQQLTQLKAEVSNKDGLITSLKEKNITLNDRIKQLLQENGKMKKAGQLVHLEKMSSKSLLSTVPDRPASDDRLKLQPEPKSAEIFPKNEIDNSNSYFIDVGWGTLGTALKRIIIKTRPDKAPEMCKVFHDLIKGIGGIYLGSKVVQTSPNNYITFQNAMMTKEEKNLYLADVNDLEVKRGAVGMRFQALDENHQKLVKSQFYVVLTDNPPPQFSYVFGYVSKEACLICEEISNMSVAENIVIKDLGTLP